MDEIQIHFGNNSELAEFEAINKGYRLDVYVIISESTYNLSVYSLMRLQQDFESEYESYGYYYPDANIILVKNTNKSEIINTIKKLFVNGFFETIKPSE